MFWICWRVKSTGFSRFDDAVFPLGMAFAPTSTSTPSRA